MADFAGSSLYNKGMPELPEVETIKRGLDNLLIGQQITGVCFDYPKGFVATPADIKNFLIGAKVASIKRRAKLLMIELSTKYSLVIHLKMTGQLVYVTDGSRWGGGHPNDSLVNSLPDKSTRVVFALGLTDSAIRSDDAKDGMGLEKDAKERWQCFGNSLAADVNAKLFFNDQRKFGWIRLMPTYEVNSLEFYKKLGPEPLNKKFTLEIFSKNLARRKGSVIKAVLLDQTIVAGIGNIYADEALFLAKIHPSLRVLDLKSNQIKALHKAIIQVLQLSIDKGGSSDRNYVNAKGERGAYLDFAKVFRREGKPCYDCGHIIIKFRVAGRGTHICPYEQKLPKSYPRSKK